ncbi:eCIS core domain-containing protein [Roseateles sp. P5_D6]
MAVSPAAALRASVEAKSRQTAVKASTARNRSITVVKQQQSFTRASSTLLPPRVQAAALRVSSPSDPAEREAVQVASAVVRMQPPAAAAPPPAAEKKAAEPARGRTRAHSTLLAPASVQREGRGVAPKAGQEVATEIRSSLGGGQALPQQVRDFMEPRFKADFGAVRIHTDGRAAGLAARLGARAFAFGRDIFFSRGAYDPDSAGGRELIAHELTHTIQQRSVAQQGKVHRDAAVEAVPAVTHTEAPQVQRLGWDTALDYFADKANVLPGFRMLTIVLGNNPINGAGVDRSPGNVFRAIVEFIPGASLVTDAISNAGIFDKVANWAYGQMKGVMSAFGSLGQAILDFVKSLGADDLLSPGKAVSRGLHLVQDPIAQIKSLAAGFIDAILEFIREAILRPLGKLAEGTDSYDLLKGVLGEDPVTGDAVDNQADAIVGGFMKLIGQDEVYNNIKKSNALDRCWAWMQGAWADLKSFVAEIPGLFMEGLKSLTIADVILVPLAFAKLAKVFGSFIGRFVSWAGEAMWELLKIVFEAVSPEAAGYVKKTGAALKAILMDPAPFVGNLIAAAKGGFSAFAGNFLDHLKKGLIDWLTGALDGVYIPKALELGEIIKFAFSVLGLTYARFKPKLVKAFGATTVAALEKGATVVATLMDKGPSAAWEQIKGELAALKDQVVEGIKGLIIEAVLTKGIPKLIAMFIPGAGFIGLIMTIYDTVVTIKNEIKRIWAIVTAFIDSIVAIANGNIGAAVSKVESILAKGLSIAINFFAQYAGLGKVAAKINGVLQKVRAPIDKAMDSLIGWVKKMVKSFIDKLAGKDAPPEEKQKRVDKAAAAALAAVSRYSGKAVGEAILVPILFGIKVIHRVTTLVPIKTGDYWSIKAEINPVKIVKTQVKAGKSTAEMEVGYQPEWPLDEFMSKANAMKAAAQGKTAQQAATLGFAKGSKTKQKSTKGLRQGGQEAFRAEIHAYIDLITVTKDRNACRGLMTQLQADHQQELQMGGTDTEENMAMIESSMNSAMGGQWRGQLKDLPPETKITKINVETKTGTAKGQKHRKSGAAAELQALLLVHAKALKTAASVIKDWFKL